MTSTPGRGRGGPPPVPLRGQTNGPDRRSCSRSEPGGGPPRPLRGWGRHRGTTGPDQDPFPAAERPAAERDRGEGGLGGTSRAGGGPQRWAGAGATDHPCESDPPSPGPVQWQPWCVTIRDEVPRAWQLSGLEISPADLRRVPVTGQASWRVTISIEGCISQAGQASPPASCTSIPHTQMCDRSGGGGGAGRVHRSGSGRARSLQLRTWR